MDRVTSIKQARAQLAEQLVEGRLAPLDYLQRHSETIDAWLADLFTDAVGLDQEGYALLAVGSYGRRELCHGSDLDLTLIHQKRRQVNQVADKIWYAVWDAGIRLDHSVRTPREALSVSKEDLRAMLGLLDGRVVAGNAPLGEGLFTDVETWWRTHNRDLLPALAASGRERHGRAGELAFLLEPDLKEAEGGLRDIGALESASRGIPALAYIIAPGSLSDERDFLLSVRATLHAKTGGSSDRLTLADQDDLAPLMGLADADELISAVAGTGREVMWATADAWRRIESHLTGPTGRSGGHDRPLGPGIVLRDAQVTISGEANRDGLRNGRTLLALAVASAAHGAPIASAAFEHIVRDDLEPVWNNELRQLWVSLLEYGSSATPVIEQLDRRRYLELYVPEWLGVRHRPQRNAYHRFTVDRHLLETVAQACNLIRQVDRPDLLLLSALFHDIGKGQPGDHSDVGASMAAIAMTRMGLSDEDCAVVQRVVRYHLLLADTATRRDLDDPATISAVARALMDTTTLSVLATLTEADSIATGSAAWSPWKAGLVTELVNRVEVELGRGQVQADLPAGEQVPKPANFRIRPTPAQMELAAAGQLQVRVEATNVTVVAPDRPGLLSVTTGVLALHGFDIRSAVAMDDGLGMAIEVFGIGRHSTKPVTDAQLQDEIGEALAGRLLLEVRLSDLETTYGRYKRPLSALPAEVVIVVDAGASLLCTVIEVRAPDSEGLLHRLTRVLAAQGLDVLSARVATMGHEVVDAFYVQDHATGQSPSEESLAGVVTELHKLFPDRG